MKLVEGAVSAGEYNADIGDDSSRRWFAKVTWKCQVCGRRNRRLQNGEGNLTFPITVTCKFGHVSRVIPYYFDEPGTPLYGYYLEYMKKVSQ